MWQRLGALGAALLPWLVAACGQDAEARPQLVVHIDTDAPVPAQIAGDLDLSADAAVDTVRVDVLGANGTPTEIEQFAVPSAEDWPVSFGVAAPDEMSGGVVRVRIRAFLRYFSTQGQVAGTATLEPMGEVTIDRVADLALPSDGARFVRVLLASDCRGVLPAFLASTTTCVDGDRLSVSPDNGIEEIVADEVGDSLVGTWSDARAVPCGGAASAARLCVPGGFSILGDPWRSADADVDLAESVPLRPARLSRYWLDRTEFTVGRLRQMVNAGTYSGPLPMPYEAQDPVRSFCSWLGAEVAANDALPVNCVDWSAARQVCETAGGNLPSEAQWEHAARGRGQRRAHPWGDDEVACCMTSASREGFPGTVSACEGVGLEPVGSHQPTVACGDFGDASIDGVLDLAGSVSEATRDSFRSYGDGCWSREAIPLDPVCDDPTTSNHIARGGSWSGRLTDTAAPLRRLFREDSPAYGFRCAYDDSAQ